MLEYRSTRFRLTAWAAFMLSATLAIMGVGGWFAMRVSLYRAIDEDLSNRLLDVEKFLQSQSDLSHEGVRKELGIRPKELMVRVCDPAPDPNVRIKGRITESPSLEGLLCFVVLFRATKQPPLFGN